MEYNRQNNWYNENNKQVPETNIQKDCIFEKHKSFCKDYYFYLDLIRKFSVMGDSLVKNESIDSKQLNELLNWVTSQIYRNLQILQFNYKKQLSNFEIKGVMSIYNKFNNLIRYITHNGSTKEKNFRIKFYKVAELAVRKLEETYKQELSSSSLLDLLVLFARYREIAIYVIQSSSYSTTSFKSGSFIKADSIDETMEQIDQFPRYLNFYLFIDDILKNAKGELLDKFKNLNADDNTIRQDLIVFAWNAYKYKLNEYIKKFNKVNDQVMEFLSANGVGELKEDEMVDDNDTKEFIIDEELDEEKETEDEEEEDGKPTDELDIGLGDVYEELTQKRTTTLGTSYISEIDVESLSVKPQVVSSKLAQHQKGASDALATLDSFTKSLEETEDEENQPTNVDIFTFGSNASTLNELNPKSANGPVVYLRYQNAVKGQLPAFNYAEIEKKWHELKKTKNIGKLTTLDLIKKLERCLDKINNYLSKEEGEFYFLDHQKAKQLGDSLIVDLLKIAEILDLNYDYKKNLRTTYLVKTLVKDPLISFYIIGTYLKHSNKPYLPENRDYVNMPSNERYSFEFDQYVEWTLDIRNNVLLNPKVPEESKEATAEFLIRHFKNAYKRWYDCLYVRYFDRKNETVKAMLKASNNEPLDKNSKDAVTKINDTRKANILKLSAFFTYLVNTAKQDQNEAIMDTIIYKSRRDNYPAFLDYWENLDVSEIDVNKIHELKDLLLTKKQSIELAEKKETKKALRNKASEPTK